MCSSLLLFRVERSAKGNSRGERLESSAFDYLNAARPRSGGMPYDEYKYFPIDIPLLLGLACSLHQVV
jgi:hypothetical protein